MPKKKAEPGIGFDKHAREDYLSFKIHDQKLSARIDELIKEALRSPLEGKGKPERLIGDLAGFYPRRIDRVHRLVYTYVDGLLVISPVSFSLLILAVLLCLLRALKSGFAPNPTTKAHPAVT